ncbi:hypothetical protein MINTM005_13070 [Mycobacterium intracellulare]|uniref:hypothetical protein n=1 Tax=Mycobacterium intracellulare TaxID=1767 RepID=UPI00192556C0|nr:hypothetical protein [Mycobacterium intracellulare]BCO56063.1 hypothetical protein MINTM005_13070 [Mycobacterium intracellulare]
MMPGVLQGFYKCQNGCDHDMLVVGSPIELTMLIRTMGLDDANVNQDHKTGKTVFTTDDGTYLTLTPAESATDLLAQHFMQQGGPQPPF